LRIVIEIEQLAEWLWRLSTPVVACYAVRQADGFNLIDSGLAGGEDSVLECLARIADRQASPPLYEILLTHCHSDHIGAAAALRERTGARILGPVGDAAFIEGETRPPAPELADWEVPLFERVQRDLAGTPEAEPLVLDRHIAGGEILSWEEPATLIDAPGHTPGSIAVLFERARILVAGDAIASTQDGPILGVFNTDRTLAVDTFRRLSELDVDVACFGHGPPLVGEAGRRLAAKAADPL
jgi:glyoxylase-like metal-dependent hydrolase (beta-lactamase superfamily II)